MSKRPRSQGEEPRSEPEIIPPGNAERGAPRTRIFVDTHSSERVYIGKPSPLGLILVVLIAGLLSVAMVVLLLGAILFVLPVAVLFITVVIAAGLLRVYFRAP